MVSIQQTSRRESFGTSAEETGKTSDQLLEVIKFLRREKEIAETKLEAVETECNRIKQRFAHMEKLTEETKKALTEERQRSQVSFIYSNVGLRVVELPNVHFYHKLNVDILWKKISME